ncbi:MAG: nitroreductase [Alcaligenaceae bacterium]|nr:nitroreductase [Alcaligenaceae bacterium]
MSADPIVSLISRRSIKFVQGPAPTDDELARILQSAVSAPDHGKLEPWRFVIIRDAAVQQLADMALGAVKASGQALPPEKEANARRWLHNVPLLIGVACHLDHANTKIPEHERLLATGAAVMNILNAAHMLGYGAFWSTGIGTYVDEVAENLGFDPLDYRFMGFVSIGTPIQSTAAPKRSDYSRFVSHWGAPG